MTIEDAIEGAASASPAAFTVIVAHAREGRLVDAEIGALARALARSGETLVPNDAAPAVDIASTGGPASLTTLVCPLFLAALGTAVVKLGVPGRPAGGIDVLARLPGFRYELTASDADRVLGAAGYVHLLAGTTFAPADAAFFQYRREHDAVAIPELAMASLLAKKLCVGVRRAGIDVRVGVGANFGASWDGARAHARRFVLVARSIGVELVCFLTDGSGPYQRYIGRGEALVALRKVLETEPDHWLDQHIETCFAMAAAVAGRADARPTRSDLRSVARAHLRAQGADIADLYDRSVAVERAHVYRVTASATGFLHVDLHRIRGVLVDLQREQRRAEPFPDPAGVTLACASGSFVERGSVIATGRGFGGGGAQRRLDDAFAIMPRAAGVPGFEQVTDDGV
jgi:thymidine phosphorylase